MPWSSWYIGLNVSEVFSDLIGPVILCLQKSLWNDGGVAEISSPL